MYPAYSPGTPLSSYHHEQPQETRDVSRGQTRGLYYHSETPGNEDLVEEEEPVLALDLRIGKATESISIFDDKNVLASSSSGFGPAVPRAGQTRLDTQSPSPYVLPPNHRRKSTSSFSTVQGAESSGSRASNGLRLFRHPQFKVSPRQMDCRKRFLEAALAASPTPSPPPPATEIVPVLPMLEPLPRKNSSAMSHLMADNIAMRHYDRVKTEPDRVDLLSNGRVDLLSNGRVSAQTKLSLWRPNHGLHPVAPPMHGHAFCNPDSPYRCSIPGCEQTHSLDRARSPILDYPLHRVSENRSPLLADPRYQHADPHLGPFHHPLKTSPYSFSSTITSQQQNRTMSGQPPEHHHRVVQTEDNRPIKVEAPSPPPPPSPLLFRTNPTNLPYERMRAYQDVCFVDRSRDSHNFVPSDTTEYKSSYLHHVLQRQRQQPASSQADFLRRHYSATSLQQQHGEMLDIDQRLKLLEQDTRLHAGDSRQTRSPSPDSYTRQGTTSILYRRFSPEPKSPVIARNSVLPLNLSKESETFHADEHLNYASHFKREPSLERRFSPQGPRSLSPEPLRDSSTPLPFKALSPASHASTTPPPASLQSLRPAEAGVKGKRGRPRKHAPKIPLPPLYIFIRNLLHNKSYNPRIISWVNESHGIFKVSNTMEFARTWGRMKSNRSEEMNYEKMSRAMRYHYGSPSRKGHLAMVKEKRLVYRFGELAIRWRPGEVALKNCQIHELCKQSLCLWTKE